MIDPCEVPAADIELVRFSRRCQSCDRAKPLPAFDGGMTRCRVCVRLDDVVPIFQMLERFELRRRLRDAGVDPDEWEDATPDWLTRKLTRFRNQVKCLNAGPPYPSWLPRQKVETVLRKMREYDAVRKVVREMRGLESVLEDVPMDRVLSGRGANRTEDDGPG